MAITGTRVSPLDGTIALLQPPNETVFDASQINGVRRATNMPVTLPEGKIITYWLPHAEVINSFYVEVTDGGNLTYDWSLRYSEQDFLEDSWQTFAQAAVMQLNLGSSESSPAPFHPDVPVRRVRLDMSALSNPEIVAFHVYTEDRGRSFENYTRPLMVMDEPRVQYPYPRKLGQHFDAGTVSRGGSTTGQFAVHNVYGDATAPMIRSHAPGDTSTVPTTQHLLFSLDRLTWTSELQLPTIPANGSSQTIYYIDNTPKNAPLGRTTTHVTIASESAVPEDRLVMMFYKDVSWYPPKPSIWFATPTVVESGGQITVFGRGLDDADWALWHHLTDWDEYSTAPFLTTHSSQMSQLERPSVILSDLADPALNVEVESATINLPTISGAGTRFYALRVAGPEGEDILHWVRANALLRGDLGLPPPLLESSSTGALSQVGLVPGGGIAQDSMSFSQPEMIVSGDMVRSIPRFYVAARSTAKLTGTATIEGRLQAQQEINAPGMYRFYPAETHLEPWPEAGPDTMSWWSTDGARRMAYRLVDGLFVDPSTMFDTSVPDWQLMAPSMVFPSGGSSRMTVHFGNKKLSNGWTGPDYTAIMVALLGPDPSPTYEEIALGVPQRLVSRPVRLMGGYGTGDEGGYLVRMEYANRRVQARSGRHRAGPSIDTFRLGRRPVIICMTASSKRVRGKDVAYVRVTYAGDQIRYANLGQSKYAPNAHIRIGHPTLVGNEFRVLDFLAGPGQTKSQEKRIISQLDSIYGVIGR